ncbi:MAG: bile acid:sodium symporter [Pseudopelagicola sp.]|nr:bile acid:sodium symporter [Pseudopelagicola sp.]
MLLDVGLPLSLAFIMFSLGFGLRFSDFGRVLAMPRAAVLGIVLQVLGVPLVAFLLLQVVELPPALAFGVMILAVCPGGVTSNILTKIAGGTVALSITLTAVVSLLSVLTVPVLVGWSATVFLGEGTQAINVSAIAVSMFAITTVPVLLGLLLRYLAEAFAARNEALISQIALVLFVVIVVAALATNWALFVAHIGHLGPLLVAMNAILLVLGMGIARLIGLGGADGICISIEMGVQNAALGITVAGLVAQVGGIPEFAIPAAVYGITMYLVTIPGMFLLRKIFAEA